MVIVILLVLGCLVFVVFGLAAWGFGMYNNLVALKNNVDQAFANIDVILKQRFDELPKLIDTCKGYMTHEKTLLENITNARTQFLNATTTDQKLAAENAVSGTLKSLFAVSENYPDLKANASFLDLQHRISVLEESIADRRELFNSTVTLFNTKIESIPDLFIARLLGMAHKSLLEIPKAETADVKVQF